MGRFFTGGSLRSILAAYWVRPLVTRCYPFSSCFLALMFLAQQGFASSAPSSDIDNLKFKYVTDAELGSIGEIRALGQDSLGFMWVGGVNGLARWDGYQARTFTHIDADSYSLTSNSVNALIAGDNGDMWVGTYWGISRFEAETERFIRYNFEVNNPRSLSSNSILALEKTRAGEVWVGTVSDGLLRYTPESDDFERVQHDVKNPQGLSSNNITAIVEDKEGLLWVGLKNLGVDVLDPKTQQVVYRHRKAVTGSQGLSHAHATGMCLAADGSMWVGTHAGLNRSLGNGVFNHYLFDASNPQSIAVENIDVVLCEGDFVWAGAGNKGLSIYDPSIDGFKHSLDYGTFIRAIYTDESGTQWVGFAEGGIARVDRYAGAVISFAHDPGNTNSLTSSQVFTVVEDAAGNFWVGTRGGLNYIDRTTGVVQRFEHHDGEMGMLPSPTVSSLVLIGGNQLWIGTTWGGLSRFDIDSRSFQRYMADEDNPHSLPNREVWSMYRDSKGILWLGMQDGKLGRYRPDTDDFVEYRFADAGGNSKGRALSLSEDSAGNLWIAGDFGLYRLPAENQVPGSESRDMAELFDFYGGEHNTDGLVPRVSVVRHVFEDSLQNIWVATGGGLIRWSPTEKKSYIYDTKDGLAHDGVTAVTEDDEGFIWVSTEGGISRLDPSSDLFKNFTSSNGLPGNAYVAGAVLNTSRGEIAFGGQDGLTILNPKKSYSNALQSPLLLTGFSLFNEPVLPSVRYVDLLLKADLEGNEQNHEAEDESALVAKIPNTVLTLPNAITHTQRIELSYEHSVITFQFALLSYEVADKNQYSYILEGFSDTWSVPSEQRMATYTNLDPGDYYFRVRAQNNEGLPMHNEINVHVFVSPPWWKTWWAYTLYVFSFLAFFSRLLHAQYQKRNFAEYQNRLLEVKVAERTKELSLAHNELKVAYKKMEEASYTDALTQLRNRHYFLDFMPPEVARVTRIFEDMFTDEERVTSEQYSAFFVVDIDHFKNINDEYGHACGDEVLRKVSSALQTCCREGDVCFRWGGEEFLVACSHQSLGALSAVAERIRASVAALDIPLEGQEGVNVTCSIGACNYPVDARNPQWASAEQTIALADWCLYLAKKSGRNCCASLQLHTSPDESFKAYFSDIESRIEQGEASVEGLAGVGSGLAQRSA